MLVLVFLMVEMAVVMEVVDGVTLLMSVVMVVVLLPAGGGGRGSDDGVSGGRGSDDGVVVGGRGVVVIYILGSYFGLLFFYLCGVVYINR